MFEQYESFIPDYEAFREQVRRPRDLFIRVNSLKIDPDDFARAMRNWGHVLEPVTWCPGAFRAPDLAKTRATLEYFLGLYYIQGATSMIPPIALGARPGERVLDMCAAPGSKTTQICEGMKNEGLVVANDIFIDRLKILKSHLERLGATCAVMTRKGGDAFPGGMMFDRILVDAPCSGEGTQRGAVTMGPPADGGHPRNAPGREGPRSIENALDGDAEARPAREGSDIERLYRLQRALLRRAANLTAPGGTIIYSTCTYNPQENEAVIDEVLRDRDDLELEEVPCDAPSSPGVTEWQGKKFRPWLEKCRRYYPHRINSWGFFVARLKRKESARHAGRHAIEDVLWMEPKKSQEPKKDLLSPLDEPPRPPAAMPAVAADPARARVLKFFEERFGVPPAAFEKFNIFEGGPAAWIASRAMPPPVTLRPWDPQNAGIRLLRYLKGPSGTYEKPTSYGLAVIGKAATKNVVDLVEPEMWAFLRGEIVPRKFPNAAPGGFVIARYEGRVLGCGLMTMNGVISQIPTAAGREVRSSLFLAPAGPKGVDWEKLGTTADDADE